LFIKIGSMIQSKMDKKNELGRFTQKEYIERAKKSNEDFLSGKTVSQEDLESLSKKMVMDASYLDRFCSKESQRNI
jgi:hypothetical protein